ncbi:MAG: aminopeptidase P N-terminal domain-containing protein [Verrucomicrobiaceae bacterium]
MRYEAVDPAFFVGNRERLVAKLKPKSMVIIHANDITATNADGTLPFKQNSDLFYLSGVDQEETVLVLFPEAINPKEREVLFVRETSEHLAVWEGDKLTKEQATAVSGIENVQWVENFEGFLHRNAPLADKLYLHTNDHLRASNIVETRNRRFIRECQERYPLHGYERVAPLLSELRMIKEVEEIRFLQKAIDITEAGFRRVMKFLKPGVGEWELEAEYLHEFVRSKSRGFAYSPIIGSGKNACVLHYLENEAVCQDGEMVLMDVGAEYGNWNADMTRTVPVNGKFSDRQKDVYNAVLNVLKGANEILRPGIMMADYQKQVIELMETELIGIGLIDAEAAKGQSEDKELVKKYFMHGTSHHLGLDVHDVWDPTQPVAVGMVFTIEPGIYIREENLGVRIEDNVIIGVEENINMFENFPTEVEEIEAAMAE